MRGILVSVLISCLFFWIFQTPISAAHRYIPTEQEITVVLEKNIQHIKESLRDFYKDSEKVTSKLIDEVFDGIQIESLSSKQTNWGLLGKNTANIAEWVSSGHYNVTGGEANDFTFHVYTKTLSDTTEAKYFLEKILDYSDVDYERPHEYVHSALSKAGYNLDITDDFILLETVSDYNKNEEEFIMAFGFLIRVGSKVALTEINSVVSYKGFAKGEGRKSWSATHRSDAINLIAYNLVVEKMMNLSGPDCTERYLSDHEDTQTREDRIVCEH